MFKDNNQNKVNSNLMTNILFQIAKNTKFQAEINSKNC